MLGPTEEPWLRPVSSQVRLIRCSPRLCTCSRVSCSVTIPVTRLTTSAYVTRLGSMMPQPGSLSSEGARDVLGSPSAGGTLSVTVFAPAGLAVLALGAAFDAGTDGSALRCGPGVHASARPISMPALIFDARPNRQYKGRCINLLDVPATANGPRSARLQMSDSESAANPGQPAREFRFCPRLDEALSL